MSSDSRTRDDERRPSPGTGLRHPTSGGIVNKMTSRPRFLLLVSDAYIAHQLLICIRHCRASATVLDFTGTKALAWSRACRSYRPVNCALINEPGDAAADLLEHAIDGERNPVIAIAAGMDATLMLARAKPFLSQLKTFPVMKEAILRELNDKWKFAALCQQLDIPHPATTFLSAGDYAHPDWYRGQPLILKPLAQSGGRGVCRIDSEAQLVAAIERAKETQAEFVVQEFVPGTDGVLSILALDGEVKALTAHVYGTGGNSAIFSNNPQLVSIAERFAASRRLTGVFELDLLHQHESGRSWILECNPRFWASVALSLFAGVNFVKLGSDQAAGHIATDPIRPPEGEWMRAGEVLARLRNGKLGVHRIPTAAWRSLYWNWSDPILQLNKRPRSSEHLQ